jgi:predicted N-formylglutamate amidohydrolase
VELNEDIAATDRAQRVGDYYRPYHAVLDATLGASLAPVLFSVHSFTPEYEGQPRAMELGVLFNHDDALGQGLNAHLAAAGYRTLANEPYSGKDGFMHSADTHSLRYGRRAVELEVRQDLCVDPVYRARLAASLAEFLTGM